MYKVIIKIYDYPLMGSLCLYKIYDVNKIEHKTLMSYFRKVYKIYGYYALYHNWKKKILWGIDFDINLRNLILDNLSAVTQKHDRIISSMIINVDIIEMP